MLKEPNCSIRRCVHFIGVENDTDEEINEKVVCCAFPDGIPGTIAYGKDKHYKKYTGQVGDFVFFRRI